MFKKKTVDQEIRDLFKFLESSLKFHVQLNLVALESIAYIKRYLQ